MARLHLEQMFDAPPRRVYEAAKDFEQYRNWMKEISSVKVVERGPGWQETEWEVHRLGQVWAWRERDEFDDQAPAIHSRLVESRFLDMMQLDITFEAVGEGCKLSADVVFAMKFAGQIIEALAAPLVRRNFAALTEGLRRRLDGEVGAAAGPTA